MYWDLDIQTNAVIKHRGPSEVLPPHPEVELLRSQLILKLRQHYRELCQQREGEGPAASPWLYRLGSRGKGAWWFSVCAGGKETCWGPSSAMLRVLLNSSAVSTPVSWGPKFLRESMLGACGSQLLGGSGRILNSGLVWAALADPVSKSKVLMILRI